MTGRKELPMEDATEELKLSVKACHILGGKRADRKGCMAFLAGVEEHNFQDMVVDRNSVKVLFKGASKWTRYQCTPTFRDMIAAYDKGTIQALIKLGAVKIPDEGLRLILRPPRKAASLEKLRSEKFKATRKASYQKSKEREKNGESLRPYKKPDTLTLQGVRSGRGFGL